MTNNYDKNMKKIKTLLKNTKNYINKIDQILHNEGILKPNRLKKIKLILNNINNDEFTINKIKKEALHKIKNILKDVIYITPISEMSQQLFMFYGSTILKNSLDQFYTPNTISLFIKSILNDGKTYLDPASGTGDLLIEFNGNVHLWEISTEAIEMANLNYEMVQKDMTILEKNSLKEKKIENKIESELYDYVVMNPPFGKKTVTEDKNILDNYILGKNKSKQELGILFIELGLYLLKENGILIAIVPGGYLGNNSNQYLRKFILQSSRILSIIKLPSATFSRSGTGVSTYLLILQKTKFKKEEEITKLNYEIHLKEINKIGYELNKKNTPIQYKKNSQGDYILENDRLIIDNDFQILTNEIKQFSNDNQIENILSENTDTQYESCNIQELLKDDNYVFETGRYMQKYKKVLDTLKKNKKNTCKIEDLCDTNANYSFKIDKNKYYKYIDISQVNTPFYNGKTLLGSKLPGRAKNKVKKNDIVISRLRGNISYTVIFEDDLIVTNGMCILRPKESKNETNLKIILANLKTDHFKIQHQSLTTGSIMESISDTDIYKILINKKIDKRKYNKIYRALTTLHELLT